VPIISIFVTSLQSLFKGWYLKLAINNYMRININKGE